MKALSAGVILALLTVVTGDLGAQGVASESPRDSSLADPTQGRHASRDTVRLAELEAEARRQNPRLLAARLRAEGALERVPQEGALPNPELALGLRNRPLDGFGTSQPMTMNVIGARQRFPWPGIQGFSQERAFLEASADSLDAVEVERQLIARLRAAYYRAASLDRAISIMTDTRTLLRGFQDVAQARYAVGDGLQQDVLQAQVAVASMTEDITVAQQRRLALAARINALVGRPWDAPLVSLELPSALGELPDADSLTMLAVVERPSLAAAQQRVAAADAAYRASRRELYPDITLSVEYGERPQYVDFLTIMVGFEVPLWAGKKELPRRREMSIRQLQYEAHARDAYNETVALVLELRAEAERARKLAQLYGESIVPQARAAVESALSAYRVGDVDYMTLVDSELTVNSYDIQTVLLMADYHSAVAELRALIGDPAGDLP